MKIGAPVMTTIFKDNIPDISIDMKCVFCGTLFSKNQNEMVIMQHCESCSKPKRPDKNYKYVCFVCKYHTRKFSEMIRHIRKHTGQKPLKCSFCDYTCSTGTSLSVHNRRHTGEKPHKCLKCDYMSITSSHLQRHMKIKH